MAEVAPAPVDPPAVKPKKKAASKATKPRNTPALKDLIVSIVAESKDRKGISTALLKKQLQVKGYEVDKNKARIRVCLKSLVSNGVLIQVTGVGASGSFKLAKGAAEPKKKSVAASKPKSAKKPASKAKVLKKAKSPRRVKTSPKKKPSPKKNVTKKAKPAAAKKAVPAKTKKAVAPKSPKAKKAAPKKASAKKTSKPSGKKAAAKK